MAKVAFVPIRDGSKGVVGKNTRELCDKPLLYWILDTLVQSSLFDEVWLATDNVQTGLKVENNYDGKVKVYNRSKASATDESSVMTVVKEFVNWRKLADSDWLCLFQATSPFTTLADIKVLLENIETDIYNSIVSCTRLKKFRWSEDGKPLDYSYDQKPRRQDYDGFLVESGNFYASRVKTIKSTPYILTGRVGIVEIETALAVDIDEPCDWLRAEYIAQKFRFTP